jgi:hypothetical protein
MALSITMRAQLTADTAKIMKFEEFRSQPVISIKENETELRILSDRLIHSISLSSYSGELIRELNGVEAMEAEIPMALIPDDRVVIKVRTEAGTSRFLWKREKD